MPHNLINILLIPNLFSPAVNLLSELLTSLPWPKRSVNDMHLWGDKAFRHEETLYLTYGKQILPLASKVCLPFVSQQQG